MQVIQQVFTNMNNSIQQEQVSINKNKSIKQQQVPTTTANLYNNNEVKNGSNYTLKCSTILDIECLDLDQPVSVLINILMDSHFWESPTPDIGI